MELEIEWKEGARMFVVGDVHGCLDQLMQELERVGFIADRDHLFALGDLVDRGPDSMGVLSLLNEPWFHSVMGNHEAMMLEASVDVKAVGYHVANGGQWFNDADDEQRRLACRLAASLPTTITVRSPSGRRIGLVHADAYGLDWNNFRWRMANAERRERKALRNHAMWSRDMVEALERGDSILPMRGVDHVYYGHNVVERAVTIGNQTWLDTGAGFRGRKLTMVEVA
jgi:serine/threonine protein phosphatase 1